jgi:hypothetical protein
MDADVITIETSRSDMELLDAFECWPSRWVMTDDGHDPG